jgi:hypothetical protein
MNESVLVSIGELWDKFTILLIKKEKIKDINKLIYIDSEIKFLTSNMEKYKYIEDKLFSNLKNVNEKLWDIEDKIRKKEYEKVFDNEFIDLARLVYYTNDERSEIKKEINKKFNSIIYEVKDYISYN